MLSYSLGLLRKVLLFGIDPDSMPHLATGVAIIGSPNS
jgi:hypothetical protein